MDRAVAGSDIVVSHGHVYPITVAAMRSAQRHRRPFVLVQHSPWVEYALPLASAEWFADRMVGRRVLRSADLVICVSRFTESYVRQLEPRSRTSVILNGVDTEMFVPLGDASTPTRREFVCVRRLVPRNGVDVLIDAWELAGLEDWRLVVIGDGSESAALRRKAQRLANISFEGFLPGPDMVSRLQHAYASVVPTRSGEGFGLAAAEAQACGVPVIAAAQGALPEVVTHERDGLHFTPGDPNGLAVQLQRLACDPQLRARLSAGAREHDWSWKQAGAQLSGALQRVVDHRQ